MKLHIDSEAKTVAIEGTVLISEVFNKLMAWFPEEWEQWSFIPFKPAVEYKEIIVPKEVHRNPYWSPWKVDIFYDKGIDTGTPINNPYSITSTKTTLNLQ